MATGEFKQRVTFNRYAASQNERGGLSPQLVDTWQKWAQIENRNGSVQVSNDQREWSYDYRITLRYTPSQVEASNDYAIWNGIKMLIRSTSFQDEGVKRFIILRCSFIEQQTTPENLNTGDMVTWYVSDGTEGNTLVMDGLNGKLNLTGKTVTEVNRENQEMRPVSTITDNESFTWIADERSIDFATTLAPGERIKITYK